MKQYVSDIGKVDRIYLFAYFMYVLQAQESLLKEMEQKEQDLKLSHGLVIKDMNSQIDKLRNENMKLTAKNSELEEAVR